MKTKYAVLMGILFLIANAFAGVPNSLQIGSESVVKANLQSQFAKITVTISELLDDGNKRIISARDYAGNINVGTTLHALAKLKIAGKETNRGKTFRYLVGSASLREPLMETSDTFELDADLQVPEMLKQVDFDWFNFFLPLPFPEAKWAEVRYKDEAGNVIISNKTRNGAPASCIFATASYLGNGVLYIPSADAAGIVARGLGAKGELVISLTEDSREYVVYDLTSGSLVESNRTTLSIAKGLGELRLNVKSPSSNLVVEASSDLKSWVQFLDLKDFNGETNVGLPPGNIKFFRVKIPE